METGLDTENISVNKSYSVQFTDLMELLIKGGDRQ